MNRKEIIRTAILAVILAVLTMAFLINLKKGQPAKLPIPPEQIYEEADYLAHLDVTEEHIIYKFEAKNHLSGILIKHKDQYYILTARHFTAPHPEFRIKSISASFKGQPDAYPVVVHMISPNVDCAILKIEKLGDSDFAFHGRLPKFGSSKNIRVGNPVYSLGSPLNTKFTFDDGCIKNLQHKTILWDSVIVHDAGIGPGSSGGPLLDKYGEVIGINVGMHTKTTGFYYAIFIDDVLNWLNTID